jgi:hypothetical protein
MYAFESPHQYLTHAGDYADSKQRKAQVYDKRLTHITGTQKNKK